VRLIATCPEETRPALVNEIEGLAAGERKAGYHDPRPWRACTATTGCALERGIKMRLFQEKCA